MDEVEYAITNFEEFLEADIGQGDLHMCSAETALAALREQQAREKGCDYCGLIYKLDGASYGTDSVIIKNRFCPMCGKRLEVEP